MTILVSEIDGFPGLFVLDVPYRCWASDNKRIVVSTHWKSKIVREKILLLVSRVKCPFGLFVAMSLAVSPFICVLLSTDTHPPHPHITVLVFVGAARKFNADKHSCSLSCQALCFKSALSLFRS